MLNITLNDLIAYLGYEGKWVGDEYVTQCPICRDNGKDNLKFNQKKNVLFCFAREDHSKEILKQLGKRKKSQDGTTSKSPNLDKPAESLEERHSRLFPLLVKYIENLINNENAMSYILKDRGITVDTIMDMNIGLDDNKNWVFPVWSMEGNEKHSCFLTGFEYRPPNLKFYKPKNEDDKPNKCKKEPGTSAILAQINHYSEDMEVLVIIEGFIDGYLFYQYLKEKGLLKGYHIVSPSNGVGTIKGCIEKSKHLLSRYKKKILYLDNDKPEWNEQQQKYIAPGPDAVKSIMEAYPDEFTVQQYKCECKDFGEHFLKCLRK